MAEQTFPTHTQRDGTTFDLIAQEDAGSGYDWSVTAILRRQSDGALFLTSDAGCSCNYFGDWDLDLTPVQSTREALRLAGEKYGADVRERLARSLEREGATEYLH